MIAKKTCRELWPMLVIYLVVMEAMLIPAIVLWPDIEILAKKLGPVYAWRALVPPSVFRDFLETLGDYRDYYSMSAYFKGSNICGAAAAVLVGTGLISGERENHTLEFLITRPLSQSRILFEKFLVAILGLTVPVFLVNWSGIPLSAWLVGEHVPFYEATLAAWHNSVFLVVLLAVTTLCSVIFRLQAHTAAVAGVFVVVQTTLFLIQTVRKYSLFQLSDIDVYRPILRGELPFTELFLTMEVWLLLATVVLYLIADRLLRRIEL